MQCNQKAKILLGFLGSQTWAVTTLSPLQESRPEILRVGKREGYNGLRRSSRGGLIQHILQIFIGCTSRSSLEYTTGEGSDLERNGPREDERIGYPWSTFGKRLRSSLGLTIWSHMGITEY